MKTNVLSLNMSKDVKGQILVIFWCFAKDAFQGIWLAYGMVEKTAMPWPLGRAVGEACCTKRRDGP